MVYRYIKPKFCHMNTNKSGGVRYIINDEKKTFNDKVYPQLPFLIRSKVSRIKVPTQFGNNPSGQLYGLAHKVTDLVREERLVLNYHKATEVRNHVERLIVEAMHNGDKHRPTMALANFWLLDKSLIHKLFKELVPRYQNYSSAFTALHYLGIDYSVYGRTQTEWKELGTGALQSKRGQCVLELRENNLPPITRPKLNRSELLTNVLCRSAFEHTKQQQQEQLSVKNE
uniref:Large ribosomal subunit protein bL17m n=1 Tax=Aceria tosichella TaxID=561515 RepID=A0A6G1SGK1_9ACAR